MPLKFWLGLCWFCRWHWVVWIFWQCSDLQTQAIFPFICVLFNFFDHNFQCRDLSPPWLNLFLNILLIFIVFHQRHSTIKHINISGIKQMFMLNGVSDDYTSTPQFRVILPQMHHEKMSGILWFFHLGNGSEGSVDLYSCIIVDSDWSHEMKRHLLLGRKVMTNLDSILKSRH